MAIILNIDTSQAIASITIARGGVPVHTVANEAPATHAAWLQPAIAAALAGMGMPLGAINAVAVSNSPGSYTGLRIGLAAAKGLCYALHKPLILLPTLEIMARAMWAAAGTAVTAVCPMVDARRMEVYTAVYNKELQAIMEPQALVLAPDSFSGVLEKGPVLFGGTGADKFQKILTHTQAFFISLNVQSTNMAWLSYDRYVAHGYNDLAYSEPFYLKPVYTTQTN